MKGGIELPVTAQVLLTFKVNDKSVSVPVLVQVNKLVYWVGMLFPLLALSLCTVMGSLYPQICAGIDPCSSDCESEEEVASVNLAVCGYSISERSIGKSCLF